ncbi:NACHT domain-containing protein [Actinomadura fibrosa]|uniref:NACHT domain-containing protein n=1 Tax=Actinomadura fibrosa TaxID=111802 RepID=A0ABW2XW84_9ACTN|nr:NACHT domain-containing protein [Actinomadura fibrosa]
MTVGARRRLLVFATATAVLAVAEGLVAWRADVGWWTLTTAVLAVPPLIVTLLGWWERSAAAAGTSADRADRAARTLAELVEAQWDAEVRTRRLDDPAPLAMAWRLTDRPVMDHLELVDPGRRLARRFTGRTRVFGRSDRLAELADRFRGLPRRRLVILGGPGMGKSTLAILLLLELLRSRVPADPVPVMFTVSGWDPARRPLTDWLTDQLAAYPALDAPEFGRDMARTLIERGRVLPVIDGLDEACGRSEADVLAALDGGPAGVGPAIITCRTGEYAAMVDRARGRVLRGAAVIEPLPILVERVDAYLRSCLPPTRRAHWDGVLAAVTAEPDGPLARALSAPLVLWLLRVVYIEGDRDPAELLDTERFPTEAAITDHLLGHLVRARADGPRPHGRPARWAPADVERWLGFLARHLSAHGTRDLAWWHLCRLVPRRSFKIGAGVVLGLVVAVTNCLLNLPLHPPGASAVSGTLNGLVFGVVSGLLIEPDGARRRARPEPVPLLGDLVQGAVLGAVAGPPAGLLLHVLRLMPTGIEATLLKGLYHGLTIGAICGLRPALTALFPAFPGDCGLRLRGKSRLLATELRAGLVVGLPCGTVLGLGFLPWLLSFLPFGPAAFLAAAQIGLGLGVVIGLVIGLAAALGAPLADAPPLDLPGALRRDLQLTTVQVVGVGVFLLPVLVLLTGGSAMRIPAVFLVVLGTTRLSAIYGITVTILWIRRRLPWRLMRFLQDAHRDGLVRQVGPIYQFRHAALQDLLAARPDR